MPLYKYFRNLIDHYYFNNFWLATSKVLSSILCILQLILSKVLLVGSQSQTIVGRPIVPDAAVHAVVEEHVSVELYISIQFGQVWCTESIFTDEDGMNMELILNRLMMIFVFFFVGDICIAIKFHHIPH